MDVVIAASPCHERGGDAKERHCQIVLTGDEEDSGSPIGVARRDLIAAGKRADVALDFEGLAQEGWPLTAWSTWARSPGAAQAAGQ
jgi:glutamate carboxypeptidase